jgi:hypothetical protein
VEPRRFFIDVQNRQFVSSPDTTFPASSNSFFEEDVESVRLYFLRPTNILGQPYEYLDYSANTVKFAIGSVAPAASQNSWTPITTTVTPTVSEVVAGGSGSNEVQRVTFSQSPISGSFALQLPQRAVTVSAVAANTFTATDHGLLDGQQVTLSGFTTPTGFANATNYFITARTKDTFRIANTAGGTALTVSVASGGGTATLGAITTGALSHNATALDVQNALVQAGLAVNAAAQIIVTGSIATGFTFTFANTQANIAFGALSVVGSTLAAAPGLTANVSFNTSEVAALILAGNTSNLNMEVEVSSGAVRQTYRTTASLSPHIITSTSPSPLPLNVATSFDLSDGAGGIWTITIDPSGTLTTAKQ